MRKSHLSLFPVLAFIFSLFFCVSSWAQGLVGLDVTGDGVPLANVPVEVLSQGTSVNWTQTDADGNALFYGLADGIYDIKVNASQAYECAACPLFGDQVFENEEVVLDGNGEAYLGTFDLVPLPKTLTVYVEANGEGVPGIDVYASSMPTPGTYGAKTELPPPEWKNGVTDETGKVVFGVQTAGKWMLNTWDQSGDYTEAFTEVNVPDQDGNTDVTLDVKGTDCSVTLTLVDQNGYPIVMGETEYAFASCQTAFEMPAGPGLPGDGDPGEGDEHLFNSTPMDMPLFFSGDIGPGKSSAVINMVGGTVDEPEKYSCTIFTEKLAADSVNVSMVSGDQKAVDVQTYSTDFIVNLKFVDNQGVTITDISAGIFAFTHWEASINHFANSFVQNGVGQLNLVEAEGLKYGLNYFIEQNYGMSALGLNTGKTVGVFEALSGNDYIGSFEFVEIETTPGTSPKDVEFVLQKADAEISVTVLAGGSPAQYTWVDVMSGDMGFPGEPFVAEEQAPIFLGKMTDQNGQATFSVLSGREYTVNAWLDPYTHGDILNPAPQKVTPAVGETAQVELDAKTPDVVLAVTLEVPEGVGSLSWAYCAAHNDDAHTFSDIVNPFTWNTLDEQGTLKLISSDDPYDLFCEGGTDSMIYRAKSSYATKEGVANDSISLTLQEMGSFYPSQSVTFDAGSSQTITFPDNCSTITFPAKSLANDGQVTLTFGSNKDALPQTDDITAYKMFDFTVKKASDGSEISQLNSPATIVLCYNEDELPAGTDESKLGCVGSNEQGTGLTQIASCEVDTEANTVTLSVTHFSDYGLNIAAAEGGGADPTPTPPAEGSVDPPTKVIAKKNGKASTAKATTIKLIWPKVTEATAYSLRITRVRGTEEPQITYKTIKQPKKKKKKKIKKNLKVKKVGVYSFAVASVDSESKVGAFSSESKTIKHKKKKKKKKK